MDASASLDSAWKKLHSIPLGKYTARKQKLVRAPKTAMHRFLHANILQALTFFRSFSSTAIDRSIGIDRFDVKKTTFVFFRKMYCAQAKNCSGPENRDASISLCKYTASAHIFSSVFERFRAPRSSEASASIDSTSKK